MIVMYGDGNSTKMVKDVMASSSQVVEALRESTGIDLPGLLAGFAGGKLAVTDGKSEEDNNGEKK